MKAKELIKILEKNPEMEIKTSIDISESEEDFDHRAFGDELIDYIKNEKDGELVLIFDGYVNTKNKLNTKEIAKLLAAKANMPYCWEDVLFRLKNGLELPFKL